MTFNFQPQLEGGRLLIRPLVAEDYAALCRIASDGDLWAQHPVPELAQEAVFAANLDDALGDEGGLTITERAGEQIIGYSRFSQRFCGTDAVEIGWTMLARRYWGGSYNGELKRLMLDHAFASLSSVMFRVGEENFRSRRALEKLGAKLSGWEQDVESYGRVSKRVGYVITRDDWRQMGH